MQCNIDQHGRRARITAGSILGVLGAAILVAGWAIGMKAVVVVGGVVLGIGGFVVFEGLKGWCALRALGIKTPL